MWSDISWWLGLAIDFDVEHHIRGVQTALVYLKALG